MPSPAHADSESICFDNPIARQLCNEVIACRLNWTECSEIAKTCDKAIALQGEIIQGYKTALDDCNEISNACIAELDKQFEAVNASDVVCEVQKPTWGQRIKGALAYMGIGSALTIVAIILL